MTAVLAPSVARAATSARVGWIDGARGFAIAAMIVSHVGLTTGLTPQWFHLVAIRPIAPVFLLLLGHLWRPGIRRRHAQLAAGAVASSALGYLLGFGFPDILVIIAGCVLVAPLAMRWPAATLALCVTQLAFWPMPDWWTNYPPGFAVALFVAGRHLDPRGFLTAVGALGSRLGLEPIGRRPMTWYLGHLSAILAGHVVAQAVRL